MVPMLIEPNRYLCRDFAILLQKSRLDTLPGDRRLRLGIGALVGLWVKFFALTQPRAMSARRHKNNSIIFRVAGATE